MIGAPRQRPLRWRAARSPAFGSTALGDHVLVARPDKTAGRIVLGPRRLGHDYVRIVARPDGSGRVEIYDRSIRAWADALERFSFIDVWRAPAVDDAMTLASLLSPQ